jgi:hypothetical protein
MVRFGHLAHRRGSDRYLRIPPGWCRREADMADRGLRRLNWADRSFPGQRRNAQSACESGPSLHLLGAALVELVRGFLQDILQIFVEFPSNNIDSFVAKLSEG